jgi:AAA domain
MSLINPRFGRPGHDRRYASGEIIHEIGDEMPVRAEAPPVAPPIDAAGKGITMRRVESFSPKAGSNGHDAPPIDDGQMASLGTRDERKTRAPDTDPQREGLRLLAWTTLSLPPRDFLLGDLLCTTSRWILVGATGIGKTLFAMELAACAAAGKSFLGWKARRKCRVMYIDGEMPAETFKERMELIAERHGDDLEIYGYNRDRLGDEGDIPPLDTQAGRDWLKREIDIIKPDLIIFDSIMCLVAGDLMKPEGWAPMLGVMRGLTSMRIAQIWLHHANDGGKVFGDKTKTWQMDTVASLTAIDDDDAAFGLNRCQGPA